VQQPTQLEEVLKTAESLDPDDRLRLIARLWESMPPDHWAAPGASDRRHLRNMIAYDDVGQMAAVPERVAWQVVGSAPAEKIYYAPRRFDLATIFVVTFAYSLLFAAMSGLNFAPVASLIVGGYITAVGFGQALLSGRMNPRVASVVTGAIAIVPITIVSVAMTRRGFRGEEAFVAIPMSAIMGAALGYLAGVLVGGVFLIADKVRQFFLNRSRTETDDVVELNEADME
jgi:hypothetical protein